MMQVRLAVLSGYIDLLRELGCKPENVLVKAGFPATFFDDHTADDMIPYGQLELLLQVAAEESQCEYFGALLGSKQNIKLLGLVGYVMQQSSDAQSALSELSKHFALHIREGATVNVEHYGELAGLSYAVTSSTHKIRQSGELAMAEGISILKAVCGSDWKPTAINFSHRSPTDNKPYRKIFNAPVYFNQDKTEIIFPRKFLNKPIVEADPALNKILQQYIDMLAIKPAEDLSRQIEALIRRTLPQGECSIENIASLMAVHRRTLHRMLKGKHTSFSEILENVRRKLATERLKNSDINVSQLADYLGYADNSAFTRAFKRWYGTTPKLWRKSNIENDQGNTD